MISMLLVVVVSRGSGLILPPVWQTTFSGAQRSARGVRGHLVAVASRGGGSTLPLNQFQGYALKIPFHFLAHFLRACNIACSLFPTGIIAPIAIELFPFTNFASFFSSLP